MPAHKYLQHKQLFFYFFSTFNFIFYYFAFFAKDEFSRALHIMWPGWGGAGDRRGGGRVAAVFTKRVTALFLYYGTAQWKYGDATRRNAKRLVAAAGID